MNNDAARRLDIASQVRHHLGSAKAALAGTPYWVWPLPLLLCLGILLIGQTPAGWPTGKPVQEIVAPVVIGLTAMLVLFVHRWARAFFTLLLACFVWALFIRELHFFGTTFVLYTAIIALAWWASSRREDMREFLKWPSIGGLLSCSIWTYFITKLLDRGYFSFLPDYLNWHDNVEETLETLAHLMMFALVVASLRAASLDGKQEPSDD